MGRQGRSGSPTRRPGHRKPPRRRGRDDLRSFPCPTAAAGKTQEIGLAFAGKCLWVSDRITDTIYRMDPESGAVLDSFHAPGPLRDGARVGRANPLVRRLRDAQALQALAPPRRAPYVTCDPEHETRDLPRGLAQLRARRGEDPGRLTSPFPRTCPTRSSSTPPGLRPRPHRLRHRPVGPELRALPLQGPDGRAGGVGRHDRGGRGPARSAGTWIPTRSASSTRSPPTSAKTYTQDSSKLVMTDPVIQKAVKEAAGRRDQPLLDGAEDQQVHPGQDALRAGRRMERGARRPGEGLGLVLRVHLRHARHVPRGGAAGAVRRTRWSSGATTPAGTTSSTGGWRSTSPTTAGCPWTRRAATRHHPRSRRRTSAASTTGSSSPPSVRATAPPWAGTTTATRAGPPGARQAHAAETRRLGPRGQEVRAQDARRARRGHLRAEEIELGSRKERAGELASWRAGKIKESTSKEKRPGKRRAFCVGEE